MSFNQFKNNFRKGEPQNHKQAKNIVANALRATGLDVWKEYPLVDPLIEHYRHNYDVVAFGKIIVVEVDDEDLHNKPSKVRNDKIAQSHAEDCFDNLRFIRLDKDTVNDTTLRAEYLQMELFDKVI